MAGEAAQQVLAARATARFERLSRATANGQERAELLASGVALGRVDVLCPLNFSEFEWEFRRLLREQGPSADMARYFSHLGAADDTWDSALWDSDLLVADVLPEPWLSQCEAEILTLQQANPWTFDLLVSVLQPALQAAVPSAALTGKDVDDLVRYLWTLCWLEAHAPVLTDLGYPTATTVHERFLEFTARLLPSLAVGE